MKTYIFKSKISALACITEIYMIKSNLTIFYFFYCVCFVLHFRNFVQYFSDTIRRCLRDHDHDKYKRYHIQDVYKRQRPIKGTRKRGETPEEDMLMRTELENSEKDKSELLMIVDLERNDLNRVCNPGSVKVTELFTVEEYATVFHLVSDIEGDLEESKNVMDLLEAAFPGGSITGAPKYRAMEIIDEMENNKRNLYTGSIGYLTLDGDCDFNIVIRTALHKDGKYYLGVGGGITAESDLEFEYEETLQKAKAVLQAMR